METNRYPLVSIGVPVFNGERSLRRCLDSLLLQDYPNLEIIISDNASTDATPSICQQYARMDARVKYYRSDGNHVAGWNFNTVFELSSGEYFLWAAHDDRREPSFVSACVERLEQRPDAVLCQAYTAVSIEGQDETLYVVHLDTFEGRTGLVERYQETLKRLPATAIYGLYRSSAMRQTKIWARVIATDLAFLQELSIHGAFIQVPEVLFRYSARETWNSIQQDARFFLGHHKPWWYVPFLVLFLHHGQRVVNSTIPVGVKLRLGCVLAFHELRQVALKVLLKVVGACCPDARKEEVGRAMYWRWMHNPNVQVVNADLFFQRVCKPQLGWWK